VLPPAPTIAIELNNHQQLLTTRLTEEERMRLLAFIQILREWGAATDSPDSSDRSVLRRREVS
jgi:hypothetical protein